MHSPRARSERANVFCLCLLDIDRLRNINDSRGVMAGDAVIAGLAARLRGVLEQPAWHRSEYTLGRYDGGALLVIARPCSVHQGETLAEALRFGVAESPLLERQSTTVSIGVAQHRIGESIDSLLARAGAHDVSRETIRARPRRGLADAAEPRGAREGRRNTRLAPLRRGHTLSHPDRPATPAAAQRQRMAIPTLKDRTERRRFCSQNTGNGLG
jgi:diguanylate cyclase (GGDEF)-like protein